MNLRFYVKRMEGAELRRGVCFIKEIVPRKAITAVARWLYNENYVTIPMRHRVEKSPTGVSASYEFFHRRRWNSLNVTCPGTPSIAASGSEAEFITEHYWGYACQKDGGCMEYKVAHPKWRVWQASESKLDADVAAIYGDKYAKALNARPSSAFLAEGSGISVYKGCRTC